jgi:hypothetical protein
MPIAGYAFCGIPSTIATGSGASVLYRRESIADIFFLKATVAAASPFIEDAAVKFEEFLIAKKLITEQDSANPVSRFCFMVPEISVLY